MMCITDHFWDRSVGVTLWCAAPQIADRLPVLLTIILRLRPLGVVVMAPLGDVDTLNPSTWGQIVGLYDLVGWLNAGGFSVVTENGVVVEGVA